MTTLAVDLALGTTGVCWGPTNDNVDLYICPTKLRAGERLAWWHDTFRQLLLDVDHLLIEAPIVHARNRKGAVETIKLHGLIEWLCHHNGITYDAVAPSTLKKAATGHGNATKVSMMNAARRLGWDGDSPDEADAFCLWVHFAGVDFGEDAA